MSMRNKVDILPIDEGLLWIQFHQGEEQAFATIMDRHFRPLYSYGTKLTYDKELVRDCIQDVFLEIWSRRGTLPVLDSPRFYLLRSLQRRILQKVTRNRALGYSDHSEIDEDFLVELAVDTALEAAEDQQQNAHRLTQLINTLPKRQKQVIYLRFFQELDYDQIAELMAMNRQSVYNLLRESIQRLRKLWPKAILCFYLLFFL